MKKQALFIALGVAIAASLVTATVAQAADTAKTVKVFLLAGQSNMQGMFFTPDMEKQAEDPKYKDLYKNLRKDGKWIVRDDVFLKYGKHKTQLTVGFGGARRRTGVEFAFGSMMGDRFDEPVLLIKTAWGGHSLYQQFRSPSAFPSAEKLQAELESRQQQVKQNNEKQKKNDPLPTMDDIKKQYGVSYRAMMDEVKETFDKYEMLFPALKGRKLEMAGFVWFQGWNDQYFNPKEYYASFMKLFIQDVRKDLGVPNLPFVIAALGQNGSAPAAGAMLAVREAQMSMNDVPEFKGNVKAFRVDLLSDGVAAADCHYNGSGNWGTRTAYAMGDAMLELMKGQK